LCALLIAGALGGLVWGMARDNRSRWALALTVSALALGGAIALGGGLYAIRQDPRYGGASQPMRDLLAALEPQLQPGDVIALNDYTSAEFFINYYKRADPVVYTLPLSPGERFSPEQPPELETPNPDAQIHLADSIIFADFAQRYDRLWLVITSSRYMPWANRPVEHYLTRHYFPVRDVVAGDMARAVLFDLTGAPPATAAAWPAQTLNAMFGDSLRLVGYDLPGGDTVQPGDTLPVSLLWEAIAPIPLDYTIGLFLVAADGSLVAQRDTFPMNYFEPTQAWRPGSLRRDNHALELPDDLPAGDYELWVAVYYWETPAERLPVDGAADHAVLTIIAVEP
jgi:hypothetical protein